MKYRYTGAPFTWNPPKTLPNGDKVVLPTGSPKAGDTITTGQIFDLGPGLPVSHPNLVPVDPEATETSVRVGGPGIKPVAI